MRLVDANDIKKRIDKFFGSGNVVFYSEHVKYLLDKAKTVDAVPVVRCKDCKYRISVERFEGEYGCNYENGLLGLVEDNYFCSYGERKDVNDEGYIREDKN